MDSHTALTALSNTYTNKYKECKYKLYQPIVIVWQQLILRKDQNKIIFLLHVLDIIRLIQYLLIRFYTIKQRIWIQNNMIKFIVNKYKYNKYKFYQPIIIIKPLLKLHWDQNKIILLLQALWIILETSREPDFPISDSNVTANLF